MSGHHLPPGPLARYAAAIAALILLALSACTSTTSTNTAGTPAQAAAAASVGPGAHPPTLTGSGSTFDAPFFAAAFAKYQQQPGALATPDPATRPHHAPADHRAPPEPTS